MKKFSCVSVRVFLMVLILMSITFSSKALAEKRGYLGVIIESLSKDVKKEMGIYHGVVIKKVTEDSPAEKAGFKEDDILLTFDGEKIKKISDLVNVVQNAKIDTKVKATVLRDKSEKELIVTVGEISHKYRTITLHSDGHSLKLIKEGGGYLGVVMQEMNADLAGYFGVQEGHGALVVDVKEESPAAAVGMKAGDVILKIENEIIESPADVCDIISQTDEGDKVKIDVMRHMKKQAFAVEIAERSMDHETIILKKLKEHDGMKKMKMHIFSPDEDFDTEDFIWKGETLHEIDEHEFRDDMHIEKTCKIMHECLTI